MPWFFEGAELFALLCPLYYLPTLIMIMAQHSRACSQQDHPRLRHFPMCLFLCARILDFDVAVR
jgi:hypothetical protein